MNYAGIFKRFIALCIDFIILSAIIGLCYATFIFIPVAIIITFLYKPIFEASRARATPGKYIMGISVVDLNGNQLTLKNSIIRYLCSIITIGYFFAIFSDKNQGLHDILAGSVVIDQSFENDGLFSEWMKTFKSINTQNLATEFQNHATPSQRPSTTLEELFSLYQKGILTEEEFKSKKEEILKRM